MDTDQVLTWDSQRMTADYVSSMLIKAKPTSLHTFCLCSTGESVHPDVLLPPYDQVHPKQLGRPTVFTEVKTHSWLSYGNSPSIPRMLSVFGQEGLTG